jgi:hypothetical protein
MIRIRPTAPITMVVISAARSPVPSPSTPSPWPVINQQRTNPDPYPETDQRCRDHGIGGRSNVDDGGIILRHIDDLRVRRLDYVDRLTRRLLYLYLLLCIAAQRAGGVCLSPQPLNRLSDSSLIR